MSINMFIRDPEELVVSITVGGPYNPDVLDDVKARVVAGYKEAIDHRMALPIALTPEEGEA